MSTSRASAWTTLLLRSNDFGDGGLIAARRVELTHRGEAWHCRIEVGTLSGQFDPASLPSPMLVWIVRDGDSITATRVVPDDGSFEILARAVFPN